VVRASPSSMLSSLKRSSYPPSPFAETTLIEADSDESAMNLGTDYHDLPRTYHDHDCIPGHPSDYPRL
jgi:hypothetical protein